MEQTLIYFDQINLNGHLYKKDSINIDELNAKVEHIPMFGQIGYPESFEISMGKASHKINNFKYDEHGNILTADIEILDTPEGELLKTIIDGVVFRPRAAGTVEEDGTINIHKLFTFDAVLKQNDAFKEQANG